MWGRLHTIVLYKQNKMFYLVSFFFFFFFSKIILNCDLFSVLRVSSLHTNLFSTKETTNCMWFISLKLVVCSRGNAAMPCWFGFFCPAVKGQTRGGADIPPPLPCNTPAVNKLRQSLQWWRSLGITWVSSHSKFNHGGCEGSKALTAVLPAMSRRAPGLCEQGVRRLWILAVTALITAQTTAGSPLLLDPEVLLSKLISQRLKDLCYEHFW